MLSSACFAKNHDVGKNSFSAALDCHEKNIRAKILSLPCRDSNVLRRSRTVLSVGPANYEIRIGCTFILVKPNIIWTAPGNSLSGFCSRNPEKSGHPAISSTLNWQRQERDDRPVVHVPHAENAPDPSFHSRS